MAFFTRATVYQFDAMEMKMDHFFIASFDWEKKKKVFRPCMDQWDRFIWRGGNIQDWIVSDTLPVKNIEPPQNVWYTVGQKFLTL